MLLFVDRFRGSSWEADKSENKHQQMLKESNPVCKFNQKPDVKTFQLQMAKTLSNANPRLVLSPGQPLSPFCESSKSSKVDRFATSHSGQAVPLGDPCTAPGDAAVPVDFRQLSRWPGEDRGNGTLWKPELAAFTYPTYIQYIWVNYGDVTLTSPKKVRSSLLFNIYVMTMLTIYVDTCGKKLKGREGQASKDSRFHLQ